MNSYIMLKFDEWSLCLNAAMHHARSYPLLFNMFTHESVIIYLIYNYGIPCYIISCMSNININYMTYIASF